MKYVGINALKEFKTKLENWITSKFITKANDNGGTKVTNLTDDNGYTNECILDNYIVHETEEGEDSKLDTLHNVIEKMQGVVLYENSSGATSTFTISDSFDNYSRLKVVIGRRDKISSGMTIEVDLNFVRATENKVCYLSFNDYDGGYFISYAMRVKFDGQTATILFSARSVNSGNNEVAIYKIIGYQD